MVDSRWLAARQFAAGFVSLVALALLAACMDSGSDDTTGTATSVTPSVISACDLLTPPEADGILGSKADSPQGGAPVSSETVRLTDCTWMELGGSRSLTLALRRSETHDNSEQAIAGIRASLETAGPVEDVGGLADAAFWGSGQLHVFRGGNDYLTVSVSGFPEGEAADAARQAAENAIGRL